MQELDLNQRPSGHEPDARIALPSPIMPVGMNGRNLQRGLLSAGYLALRLSILPLTAAADLPSPEAGSEMAAWARFMAVLARLFALVGNRGLIHNSIRYARFHPPALAYSGQALAGTHHRPSL